ncbi:histone-lysine N-methyltransferase EHMT2 isoform X1 [Hydra vulgaris]|uniref:histone-lysine N-methyltransferase EHMT2 isoform X1 n=1 Tax=Hydra vulgaris TaxID=6087 RepID=UPI001F5F730A|nr:histone-lysine N-methyltransferase EHMT2 [Hydra vulgaris]
MKRNFEKDGLLELKKSGALKQDVKDNETSPEHKKQSEYQHPIVTSMTQPGPCTLRIRPRLSTFAPTLSNLIPSARMGPPYPSANHILLMPRVISNNYRQKMISAVEPARSCPFVINLDESSSSPSPSSSETEGDDTETSNNTRSIESEKVPLTIKEEISNSKYDNKAVMRVGASRGAPPIIVLSDSSDEEEISKQNLQPKARLSVRDQIPQKKVSNEFVMEVSQLIGKSIDEDLLAVAQFGMEMIEVESMVHKLLNNCDTEKPKRVSKRAFYQCVKHGNNLPKVLAFLNAGLNPTERIKGVDGLTALHVAAMKGHLEILLLLIFKVGRKNVDCADKRNKTPLFYAIEKKHLKTAQFLVKVGADVHLANADGMTLLHIAARNGNLIFVKWLVSLGVSLNQQDNYGWTALMWATEHDSNAEIIKYLIKIGAHTNVLDNEMNICLHWAAMTSSFECVCELVNNPLYSHINACNRFGETPLHIAAKMDNYHIVQFLLASGADHTIKNFSGLTALNVCPIGSKTFHCIRIRDMVGEVQKTPYFYLTDISNGKERIPISCLNEVDNEPFPNDFIYISKPEESCHLKVNRGFSTVKPCKCEVSCGADCKCIKLSENQKLWYTEDGKIDISIFEEESPVLFECTPLCSCWNICPNRLVQKGIPFPLQVIKTTNKGWGLRTLNPIPLGSFILSYVGELITDEEAERRNADTYLFNLDLKTSGDEPNCMDALRYGNCGRFINHSCDANVRAIKLFTSHRDVSCPEIAFFAYKDIKAYEELCFNYGDSFWDVKIRDGMFCKCLYEFCQYSGESKYT